MLPRRMDGAKGALAKFIYEELPPLLRAHNGRMRKEDGRKIIEAMFRERHGWPEELDRLEDPGRPVSSNAWGWALHYLCVDGITMKCSGGSLYELTRP